MGRKRDWLGTGLAACLALLGAGGALPAGAQAPTPLTTDNSKIVNTIGAGGADAGLNGQGNANFSNGVWEVNGGGDDVWSTADGMTFVNTALEGDGNITARILNEKGGSGDGWSRSGIMLRENDQGDGISLGLFFANEDGDNPRGRLLHSHWRIETGGSQGWAGTTGPFAVDGVRLPSDGAIGLRYFPLWMRIQRQGNTITEFRSDDGNLWEQLTKPQDVVLPATARAGIFATAHTGPTFETAHFDNVSIGKQILKPGPSAVQITSGDGTALLTWTGAPGADSYNVYRRSDPEKGAAATAYEKITATPTKNNFFTDTGLTNGKIYRYVVTGGVGTEETAAALQAVAMPSAPLVIGKGQFFPQVIDTQSAGSVQQTGDGQLVITAGGGGVARNNFAQTFDSFLFLAAPVDGNATLTAQLSAKPTTNTEKNDQDGDHPNGGVGLMVREGLGPTARFGMIAATLGNGTRFSGRSQANTAADVSEDGTDDGSTTYPLFLRVQRAGDIVRGFQSTDGKTFTQVGSDLTLSGLKGPVYIGFATASAFEGFTATAHIDAKSITLQ